MPALVVAAVVTATVADADSAKDDRVRRRCDDDDDRTGQTKQRQGATTQAAALTEGRRTMIADIELMSGVRCQEFLEECVGVCCSRRSEAGRPETAILRPGDCGWVKFWSWRSRALGDFTARTTARHYCRGMQSRLWICGIYQSLYGWRFGYRTHEKESRPAYCATIQRAPGYLSRRAPLPFLSRESLLSSIEKTDRDGEISQGWWWYIEQQCRKKVSGRQDACVYTVKENR